MGTHTEHDIVDRAANIYQGPPKQTMKDIRRAATRERRKYHLHYFLTRGWYVLAGLVVLLGIWATLVYIMRALTEHP